MASLPSSEPGSEAAPGSALLTCDDLVARWGGQIKRGTLAAWRARGKGPIYLRVGTKVLYPLAAVLAFESQGLRKGKSS